MGEYVAKGGKEYFMFHISLCPWVNEAWEMQMLAAWATRQASIVYAGDSSMGKKIVLVYACVQENVCNSAKLDETSIKKRSWMVDCLSISACNMQPEPRF